MVNSAVSFYLLLFYTDTALIPAALAGTALLIGKIWDAVNDPLFGWISDRTTSRLGKRRVYMLLGALPLALAVMSVWFVPAGASLAATFIWVVVAFLFFDTMVTVTSVPYYALTAELTDDYDERASLTTFRMLLGVPGFILGAALTPALVKLFGGGRPGYALVGVVFGVIAAVTLWICAAGIKERPGLHEEPSKLPMLKSALATFKNRVFLRLVLAYLIANLAFTLVQTLLAYFLTYQLKMADQVPVVMLLMLVSVLAFLFPWKLLSDRWSKGPAYALGLTIGGVTVLATFLLPHQPTPLIYGVAVVAGMGFSSNWVFPWAMVPDVIEYDQLETGEQRSGMYYGVWGFSTKLTAALGAAMAGWALALYHYVPNAEQTAAALTGIRLFFGPVPALALFAAAPLLVWYPINRQKHAEIRARLAARDAAQADKPGE